MPEPSLIDGLAEVDLAELSDAALLDLVDELSVAANRVAAALTSVVRAADRRGPTAATARCR